MGVLGKSAKPNLLSLALWEYSCEDSHLDTSNTKVCLQVMVISIVQDIFLVQFFDTRKAVAPLADDPILLCRSIWSLRHPGLENLRIVQQYLMSQIRSDKIRGVTLDFSSMYTSWDFIKLA